MISYALVVCIAGLLIWLIFTKWKKVADVWVAEFGRIMFACGLLAYLLTLGVKVL